MTYGLGVALGDHGGLEAGTSLLVSGSYAGSLRFVQEVVEQGVEEGDGTVYVTAGRPADEVLDSFDASGDRFAVVDCSGEGDGTGDAFQNVRYAVSPADMTGIGVEVSNLLEEYHDGRGIDRNRVVLDSVSELLVHSDLETVFRFLHVFTGRVRNVGGLGVFVIDRDAHDDKEYSTVRQLFDGVVEVEENDGVRVRLEGLSDEPTDWVTIEP